jgi:hypothetical protein
MMKHRTQRAVLRKTANAFLLSAFCVLISQSFVHALPTLTVGVASGQAGTTINLPITFDPSTSSVAGIQFSLTLPASLSTGAVTPGVILSTAAKSVSTGLAGSSWTFIVFGLNQNTIGPGLLLTAQLQIAPGTATGTLLSVPISGSVYSDINGNSIAPSTSTSPAGTITVTPPKPVITSPLTASGTVGVAFTYAIVATSSPVSYNATGLPSGLTISTTTGMISGTPVIAGTSTVTLSATNAGGTGTAALTLTIRPQAPGITSPASTAGKQGRAFLYQILATNSPASYSATGLPNGLVVSGTTGLISGTPVAAGTSTVTLSATNAGGTGNGSLAVAIFSGCDLNNDGITNVLDLQLEVNEALGLAACTDDVNKDGVCNVLDIQRVVNAALGGACIVGP